MKPGLHEDLIRDYSESSREFLDTLSTLDESVFLLKPGEGKWNISEIVEHVNISDKSSYLAMLKTSGEPTREESEVSEKNVAAMLDTENMNFIAPEAAHPKGQFKTPKEAIEVFEKTRNRILDFVMSNELRWQATGFAHPRLGYLSRIQWLRFVTWHSRHHLKQIRAIISSVSAEN